MYSDSEVIIKQLNGNYKVKSDSLIEINSKARALIANFSYVRLANLPRGDPHISDVDRMLNRLLDRTVGKADNKSDRLD